MKDKELIRELNKILTLEHGHLGMYENFLNHRDKDTRRTFRRFMEIEKEHINKVTAVILNMGGKPSIIVESGDIIGQLFGITVNAASDREVIKAYSFIEKKSHQGYNDFVTKLENDSEIRNQFIAEIASSNMVEAQLMHLWLEDKLKTLN
ncbi:demethoxyubiquinone hydroxylase family protein [Phosphitispora fastidiosa]|uniref:demethoxyubiquinone hydroxylase family protein n=1 Tax=Phosphitispora fastidiosa TaxID=2837202 RepID=UPI001E5098A5|nr:demethoxyubiquinone hydroxylase family protein [Phosphitispora fastidiosa]MBU7005158.1 rubrerythrin [Phosphitispora fastidiosa]